MAQRAKPTATTLAHEGEADIAEDLHSPLDNVLRERADARRARDRMQRTRDEAQDALDNAQHIVRRLDQHVARLIGQDQDRHWTLDVKTFGISCGVRYSPLSLNPTHYTHRCRTKVDSLPHKSMLNHPSSIIPTSGSVSSPREYTRPFDSRLELDTSVPGDHTNNPPSSPLLNEVSPLRQVPQPDRAPSDALRMGSATETVSLCDFGGYTLSGRLEPGIRIGANGVQNPIDMHAYLWRRRLQEFQTQAGDIRVTHFYDRLNDLVDAILSRPGRYAELVAALFPDAPPDFTLDPATSVLGLEHMPDPSSLAHDDDVIEEDVARWMYGVLNVSREAARLELEPYFRRRAHYCLAVQAWRDTLVRDEASPNTSMSMALFVVSHSDLEYRFHSYRPFAYPAHCVTLFVPDSNMVAWDLPEDDEEEIEDVAVDFSWLPSWVANKVMARYRALCIASDV